MKIKITKKNVLVLALVFSMIICITGVCGYMLWRNNLSINIDSDTTYVIDSADLTTFVQYSEMTETFVLSFIFTVFGMFVGFIIDTFILLCFTLIRLIVDNQGFFEYRRKFIENEEKKKKQEEKEARKAKKKAEKEENEDVSEDIETEKKGE